MTDEKKRRITDYLKSAAAALCLAHEMHAEAAPALEACVRDTQAEFQAEQQQKMMELYKPK